MGKYRPDDGAYYEVEQRTDLLSQGDIFRDVPLAYPTLVEELDDTSPFPDDWHGEPPAAGHRRFLSGPLDFGSAMLITPSCAMTDPKTFRYAHHVRTLVVIRSVVEIVNKGYLTESQIPALRARDQFRSYMYLPASDTYHLPESVALLYYPVTLHHNFLAQNRLTQLAYQGAQQLQRKLVAFYASIGLDLNDLNPPMD